MHAAAMSFDLHIPESRSLKAKRAAIRPIVDGMRHRFRISVAEVDHQDQWQRATIAVAVVAESEGRVRRVARRGGAVRRRRARRRAAAAARSVGSSWRTRRWCSRGSVRRYPRMARVNEVVREVIADELERLSDPRLGLVTVTGVEVSADLRHATVYYSALDPGREQPKRSRRSGARVGRARTATVDAEVDVTPPRMRRPSSRTDRRGAAFRGAAHSRRARSPGPHEVRPRAPLPRRPGDRAGTARRGDHPRACTRRTTRGGTRNDRRRRCSSRARRRRSTAPSVVALACHVNPDGDALGSMLGLFHVLRAAVGDVVALVSAAVRRRAALPRAPRARPAHEARGLPGRARRDGHLRLRLARPARRPRSPSARGRARAHRARPPRVEHPVRHHQRHRSRRRGERRARPAPRPRARPPARRRVRGVPLRRAGVRHRALPVRHDHAGGVRARPASSSSSTCRCRASRASSSRSTGSRTSSCSPRRSSTAVLDVERHFVWTIVTQDMLERHDVTLEEIEGLIDILRRTTEAEVTCVMKEEADGNVRVSLRSLGDVDVSAIAAGHGGGGHRFAGGLRVLARARRPRRAPPRRPLTRSPSAMRARS